MADVQFDTDNKAQAPTGTAIQFVRAKNKMAGWLMRRGIVKSESQALYVLIGFISLLSIVSVFFLILGSSAPKRTPFIPGTQLPNALQ